MKIIVLIVVQLLSLLLYVNSNNNIGNINSNTLTGSRIKSYLKDQDEAKLPWPATFFVNMLKKDNNSNKYNNSILIIPKSNSFINHPIVSKTIDFIKHYGSPILVWIRSHRRTYAIVGRATVFTLIGVFLLRKVSKWYKGMAEFELLLDQTDYDYQSFGCILNGIGGSLVSSINQTAVSEFKYTYLYRRLSAALDSPCFPQTMSEYCIQTGRDIALLIGEVDSRMRGRRNRLKQAQNDEEQREEGNNKMQSAGINLHEQILLTGMQRGITLLQVRQGDVFLRLSRAELLKAANTVEDLLTLWRASLATKTQSLRLPLPRFLRKWDMQSRGRYRQRVRLGNSDNNVTRYRDDRHMYSNGNGYTNGNSYSNGNGYLGGHDSYEMNESENMVQGSFGERDAFNSALPMLEEIQRGLYAMVGQIQMHLDSLQTIQEQLVGLDLLSTSSETAWNFMDDWVAESLVTCSNSLALLLVVEKIDGTSKHFSITPEKKKIEELKEKVITNTLISNSTSSIQKDDTKDIILVPAETPSSSLHHGELPYSCSAFTLALLCRLASYDDIAGVQGCIKLGEFLVPSDVETIIEKCLIRSDSFAQAIESVGDDISSSRPWDHVRSSDLKASQNFTDTLQEKLSRREGPDKLWAREISYTHHRGKGNLLAPRSTNHNLVQILHTGEIGVPDERGNAILIGFMNLSDVPFCNGCSYTTRWSFETVSINQDETSESIVLEDNATAYDTSKKPSSFLNSWWNMLFTRGTRSASTTPVSITNNTTSGNNAVTKVSVTLDVRCPTSMYQSMITAGIVRELKLLVEHWRVKATSILIEPAGWADLNKQLPPGEADLLDSIGRNSTDEYDNTNINSYTKINTNTKLQEQNKLKKITAQNRRVGFFFRPEVPKLNEIIGTVQRQVQGSGFNNTKINSLDIVPENSFVNMDTLSTELNKLRGQWRLGALVLRDLTKAPTHFIDYLENSGLKKKSRRGLSSILQFRLLFRIVSWSGASVGALLAARNYNDIAGATDALMYHLKDFAERRITTPTKALVNDMILNRRMSLTDKEALKDAKRSLSAMLEDFLLQHKRSLSESERKRIASSMDMSPISVEYETELKRPMQNIVSGRIARLVLIQLQFVKKELLVAMQAIDELFNANQVNLQLLAVTPVILTFFFLQSFTRTMIAAMKSTSRGRFIESTAVVHKHLRSAMRELERLLCMSQGYRGPDGEITSSELGKLMSVLFRLHNTLVLNSAHFDEFSIRQLQEDLRDIAISGLTVGQRLAMVERVIRSYPFLQNRRVGSQTLW